MRVSAKLNDRLALFANAVRIENSEPRVLTADGFYRLLAQLAEPYRTMVLIAQCLGLRVSEIWVSSGETSISKSARS